jgi:hypothetical protein
MLQRVGGMQSCSTLLNGSLLHDTKNVDAFGRARKKQETIRYCLKVFIRPRMPFDMHKCADCLEFMAQKFYCRLRLMSSRAHSTAAATAPLTAMFWQNAQDRRSSSLL